MIDEMHDHRATSACACAASSASADDRAVERAEAALELGHARFEPGDARPASALTAVLRAARQKNDFRAGFEAMRPLYRSLLPGVSGRRALPRGRVHASDAELERRLELAVERELEEIDARNVERTRAPGARAPAARHARDQRQRVEAAEVLPQHRRFDRRRPPPA